MPITAGIINKFLEDFKEGFISCLCLTITLWEIGAGEVVMDVEGGPQFFHVYIFKISSMVYENGGWDAKATNDMVEDELRNLNSLTCNKRDYFNPLSEIIYGCNDPFVTFKG